MKLHTSATSVPGSRRRWLKALAVAPAALAATSVQAAFGSPQIPTRMLLSISTLSARRGAKVTATARLTRIDTERAVPSVPINFWFGSAANPNSQIGTRVYTNANGEATCQFTVSTWTALGRNVILAEFTGNGLFAAPLPYASLTVQS